VELYLVRHAIAAKRDPARWPDDSQRPLTPDGVARFRPAARGLARIVPTVERVFSSPFPRAWQTAEILNEESGWPAPEPREDLAATRPPDDGAALLDEIDAESVALVGHEPNLSLLASFLLTGDHGLARLELKKGGSAFLELPDGAEGNIGTAILRWSLSPKIMRALDGGN
jgi:phosphohistidine phosphatase